MSTFYYHHLYETEKKDEKREAMKSKHPKGRFVAFKTGITNLSPTVWLEREGAIQRASFFEVKRKKSLYPSLLSIDARSQFLEVSYHSIINSLSIGLRTNHFWDFLPQHSSYQIWTWLIYNYSNVNGCMSFRVPNYLLITSNSIKDFLLAFHVLFFSYIFGCPHSALFSIS